MPLIGSNLTPDSRPPIPEIIGSCSAMQSVYQLTRRVAKSNASVLIHGETGTGKELIADAIHRLSNRKEGPLVQVNCGALNENLLESELFGHVRGAFTGAVANRTGRFEAAHGGTIFLDEINSTSLYLQVKLLRVLQERSFERVGDTHTLKTDTRFIAASNRDLRELVEQETFREDLYWRLNVVSIELPPLRERREDIPELVAHFLTMYSEANDRCVVHFQPEAMELMQQYHWPGNVRELQNYVERAVVLAEGDELTVGLLPAVVTGQSRPASGGVRGADLEALTYEVVQRGLSAEGPEGENLHAKVVKRIERELIVQVMLECDNVQTRAARRLGVNRNTLHKKLKDYGLDS